jgi:hypothetical protein
LAKKPSTALSQVAMSACSGTQSGGADEPGPHLGVLVAAVVVEDDMDDFAGRDRRLDRVQKTDEL